MYAEMGRLTKIALMGSAMALVAMTGAAQPAAYEPFSYPTNAPIQGKNGGTGWGGAWTGPSTNVVNPGLTYPGLGTLGRALGRTPGSASTRPLASPILGAPGTSMVLSALFRSDVAGTPATQATLGNTAGGFFVIGDLPLADPAANRWGLQNGTGSFFSTVAVAANTNVLLVAQIDFDVSGTNDRMRLWVNPPANAFFTVAPNVDVTNADLGQFSGVFWQTQQNQRIDEIRVSSSRNGCVLPPNTTMVAWYPFDETSGTMAANLATSNFGVHVNGPAPSPGLVLGALHFDGADDYVDSLSSIVTNFGPASNVATCSGRFSTCPGDFSIDAWIRLPPSGGSGQLVLVDKRAGSPPAIKGYHVFLNSGTLGLQLADGVGTGFSNYLSPAPVPSLSDGNWHHVAVTVRRTSASGVRFYHNGALIGTANPTGRTGSLVNNSPLRIGSRTTSPALSGFFQGDIDELEIFNRVLTPAEITALFQAGPFGKCK